MILFWIRKNDKDPTPPKFEDSLRTFREHDEDMKKFREVHPSAEMAPAKERRGAEDMALVLLPPVKLVSNSQN